MTFLFYSWIKNFLLNKKLLLLCTKYALQMLEVKYVGKLLLFYLIYIMTSSSHRSHLETLFEITQVNTCDIKKR